MSSDSGKIRAVAAVMAAGILWGMLGLAVRHFNAAGLSALDITALRAAGAAIVLWIAAVTFFRSSISIRLRDCWCFAGCGIASIVLFNICYFFTVNRTSLGVAATLLYTSPVFVALMARLFFGERFTLATGAALIMTISGCALVSGIRSGASLAMPIDAFSAGICSGFCYALFSIFGRFAQRRGYNSFTITLWSFTFAAAALTAFANWKIYFTALSSQPVNTLVWTGAMIIFGTVLPYFLYTLGLGRLTASNAAIYACIEPVTAALTGIVCFRERPDAMTFSGTLLIIGAVVMMQLRRKSAQDTGNQHL